MRNTSKTLVGGVLAALLVLSASPAQAFGPQDPVVGTEQEAPVTDSPATIEEEATEEVVEAPAEDEEATPNAPESDGTGAEEEAGAEEAPASEAAAAQVDASKTVTVVPQSIEVSGTVLVVPDEASATTFTELEAGVVPETHTGAVLVATSESGILPVNPEGVEGELEPGAHFSGTVTVPAAAAEELSARIAAEGAVSVAEVAEAAHTVAAESGTALTATGTTTEQGQGLAVEAAAGKNHPIDIVNFGGAERPAATDAQLKSLANAAGNYWKSQTNGAISSMSNTGAKFKTVSPAYSRCMNPNYDARLWDQAIRAAGYNDSNAYIRSGRHLVAFVNSDCSGAVGWGTIGSLHSGGITWINLGARPVGEAPSDMVSNVSHELGHNMGLGHGDARFCSSPHSDGPTTGANGRPTGGNGCYDVDYADVWNVMGFYMGGDGLKPPALNMAQKKMLGVTSTSMLKEVSTAAGAEQTFTLNGAGATTGLRGLRVASPSPGGAIFVEYRNGAGQDNGVRWSDGGLYTFNNMRLGTGVHVTKGYAASSNQGGKRAASLLGWSGGNRYLAARQGTTIQTNGDTARVYVQSAGSNAKAATATVRVQFKGFKNGGKSVTTGVVGGGAVLAGKTLKANLSGSWKVTYGTPGTVTDTYQWYRSGKAISGATKSTYKTTAADIGKSVTVKVKPKASGFVTNTGVTAATKTPTSPFYDVLYGQKFYSEINWMKSSGISKGTTKAGKSYYEPKANVTREAMAAFIYRMEKANYKAPGKSPFVDVKPGAPFYREITWMYKAGISTGTMKNGKRYYEPKAGVTREAMSAFMYRVENATYKGAAKSPFADVPKNHKFYKQISWMKKEGITTGTARNGKLYYDPKSKVTREAMAAFMYRMQH